MPLKKYEDWQPAAEASKQRKAVSRRLSVPLYSKTHEKPMMYDVEIVKPLHGDPWMIYAKTGLKVMDGARPRKVTAQECDSAGPWKAY